MCQIAKQLLAEKLIDDFYEEYSRDGKLLNIENLTEHLKALVPREQHELIYRWEAECAEQCGQELRNFANFVAGILTMPHLHLENDERCDN